MYDDSWRGADGGPEAFAQDLEVWQAASFEFCVNGEREFTLAGPFMGQREQANYGSINARL